MFAYRRSRSAAVFIMLSCMLMMHISIAACRCIGVELQPHLADVSSEHHVDVPIDTAHDGHCEGHADEAAPKADAAHPCNKCPEARQMGKKILNGLGHSNAYSFVPGALVRVVTPNFPAGPIQSSPHIRVHALAASPPARVRHCSLQL